ncbi:hypothetical protein TNCT_55511 [Trichonephila clavata]|uniref:Uncharacterized protein n=1 Tax=Trichonephila clavata TaxID=2740835 RepID=A0A8X6ITE6_TRICU|nr:hypothetical protein TNCT_55511 [Trichonephila clavata]
MPGSTLNVEDNTDCAWRKSPPNSVLFLFVTGRTISSVVTGLPSIHKLITVLRTTMDWSFPSPRISALFLSLKANLRSRRKLCSFSPAIQYEAPV